MEGAVGRLFLVAGEAYDCAGTLTDDDDAEDDLAGSAPDSLALWHSKTHSALAM